MGLMKVALRRAAHENVGVHKDWKKLCDVALAEVELTLESLPRPLR